jgi:hypothetical protein
MSRAGIGKLQNLSITVQRRWSNVVSDAAAQQVVEMFLGLRPHVYFPSAHMVYASDLPPNVRSLGYTWSYLACRIGHLVPIWRP